MFTWIVKAAVLMLLAYFVPGIHVASFWSALGAVVAIGLVNLLARPILLILTLPITVLTLGLFLFVLNGAMFYLAGHLFPGFRVDGLLPAIVASFCYSVLGGALAGKH